MPTPWDPKAPAHRPPRSDAPLARLRRLGIPAPAEQAVAAWWDALAQGDQRRWAATFGVATDADLVADWAFDSNSAGPEAVLEWVERHRCPTPAAAVALGAEQARPRNRLRTNLIHRLQAAGDP